MIDLSKLPEFCFAPHPECQCVVLIERGAHWSCQLDTAPQGPSRHLYVEEENRKLGVNPAQMSAMMYGAFLGWDDPMADPDHPRNQEHLQIWNMRVMEERVIAGSKDRPLAPSTATLH